MAHSVTKFDDPDMNGMAAACPAPLFRSSSGYAGLKRTDLMQWYVIRTKPHQERVAEFHLRQVSVETFLPLLRLETKGRRQGKTVVEPLFPRYLFAQFNITERYRAVNFARGVLNIVEFGMKPAQVSEALIDGIKSRMEDGYVIPQTERFQEGQIVHITGGPLAGLEAVFVKELKEQQRVLLLLRALGLNAKITMDIGHLSLPQAQ
jgi:transcriptional antiterminator RfaH